MFSFERNEQQIDDLSKLDTNPIPDIPYIKSEYINLTGKQSSLVNSAQQGNVAVQTGKITIKFLEPMWVYDLTIWTGNEDQANADKLCRHTTAKVTYSRGDTRDIELSAYDSYLDCYPKDFVSEIEIKFFNINKILISTPPKCQKITLRGLSGEDYAEFCGKVGTYLTNSRKLTTTRDRIQAELTEKNNKLLELQNEIEALEHSSAATKRELATEQEKLSTAREALLQAESQASLLTRKSTDIEQRISENERSNQNLIVNIQDNKAELERLLANKNVFMEEFSSYVEQGKRNIQFYTLIGIILLFIIGLCLKQLITSALTLSNDPTILQTISAFDLFLSRLPIAFVLGLIMIASVKILYTLLGKIFEIHQERLLLSKLSILAKDNSFFSATGVNVSSEIIYDKRVSLKMELLKEFLSGNYRGAAEKEKEIRRKYDEFKSGINAEKGENSKKEPLDDSEDDAEKN
ncbi:MAG: hypothetical protein KAX90_00205 [Pseudomonas sp.]|nr:hypothetical protein [Pseudomonas sp.]